MAMVGPSTAPVRPLICHALPSDSADERRAVLSQTPWKRQPVTSGRKATRNAPACCLPAVPARTDHPTTCVTGISLLVVALSR